MCSLLSMEFDKRLGINNMFLNLTEERMKTAIITISEQGLATALRIGMGYKHPVSLYALARIAEGRDLRKDTHFAGITCFPEPLHQLVPRLFKQFDGLVFIMAMGIVVRMVAPCVQDKYTDPAVVVVDDVGRFVVSMLSGHEGGANVLASRIAAILHTDAVITTGTEAQKDIIIGIGCKKGVTAEAVKSSVADAIQKAGVGMERVRLFATIDIKAEEAGLLQAAEELGIPLRVVSKSEIAACSFEYGKSDFVKEKIGVWAVCEPAALIAGRKTQLILKKQKYPGVTVAIALENFTW